MKSAIAIEENDNETETSENGDTQSPSNPGLKEKEIMTTEEEMEAFYIVRSILRPHIDSIRITHRDALSYFAIFQDDNNRKPICRLYLNSLTKIYIGIFGEDKKETKIEIKNIDEIYEYGDKLISTLAAYNSVK